MDFRDSWLYSDFIHPNMQVPLVKKGISIEKFKEVVAGWKELANMYRIQKAGLWAAAQEMARQGRIDMDDFLKLSGQEARRVAKEDRFNLDAAQKKFNQK